MVTFKCSKKSKNFICVQIFTALIFFQIFRIYEVFPGFKLFRRYAAHEAGRAFNDPLFGPIWAPPDVCRNSMLGIRFGRGGEVSMRVLGLITAFFRLYPDFGRRLSLGRRIRAGSTI